MLTPEDLKDMRGAAWRVMNRAEYDPANVPSETIFLAQQLESLLDDHAKLRKVAEAAQLVAVALEGREQFPAQLALVEALRAWKGKP